MADLPVLPILPATLSRLVSEAWEDRDGLPGVARTSGVDPAVTSIGARALFGGGFELHWYCPGPRGGIPGAAIHRALSALADVLEGQHYLVVDRTAGLRVMGWAAYYPPGCGCGCHGNARALADLPPTDPRRIAWDDRCMKERAARLPPMPAERAEKLRRFGR